MTITTDAARRRSPGASAAIDAQHECGDGVLVVGSDRRMTKSLARALVRFGCDPATVRVAPTLLAARDELWMGPVGCILLDLGMPNPGAIESIGALTAAAPDTAIVTCSVGSEVGETTVYAALAEGADEHVELDADRSVDLDRLRGALQRGIARRRRTGRLRHGERFAEHVFESIDAPAAVLDSTGRIIGTNRAWIEAGHLAGASSVATGVGISYLRVCDLAVGAWSEGAAEAAAGIRAVLDGTADRFSMDYPCPDHGVERWFTLRVTPTGETGGGAIVTHIDTTDLKQAELRLQAGQLRIGHRLDETAPIFALVAADGFVLHVSDATRSLLGFEVDHLVGASPRIDTTDGERARAAIARVGATPGARESLWVRVIDATGRARDLDLAITNLLDDPAVGAITVVGADITAARRHQVTEQLESRLLEHLPTAAIVTDDRGVVVYWNDRATQMFGYAAADAVGRRAVDLSIGPAGRHDAARIMRTVVRLGHWEGEFDALRADGTLLPVHAMIERVDLPEIDFRGVVAASIDVTERRQLEANLAFQAHHDALTGLPNRRLFIEHLEGALHRHADRATHVAVLFLDVDDFKSVNDSLGHAAGDEVLQVISSVLSASVRPGDLVARLGGDEFVVCCEGLDDVAAARALADRIHTVLQHPFDVDGRTVSVSASVGLAVTSAMVQAEVLLRNADAAMYAAKESGAPVELYDDELVERARERRELAAELDRAIDLGQLVVHFQPEVELTTGFLFGFEALVRWEHPERGLVPPNDFIELAEECGLIGRLGAVVMRNACAALAEWRADDPTSELTVSVNVSAKQLSDPSFACTIRNTIDEFGLPPRLICLEVTESALMDTPEVADALRAVRDTGVMIAIDDFGTGYSSLSRLKRFPVDFLKIDRTFVTGLGHDAEDDAIVSAVVNLAASLGLELIAEGVETDEHLALLANLGCRYGQGWLWSKAVPAAEVADLIARQPHTHATDVTR